MEDKINSFKNSPTQVLLLNWRPGQVLTTAGLKDLGITKQLASHLKKRGILAALGDGAFRKSSEMPPWSAAVEALEQQLHLAVHAGGRTALEMSGAGQYAAMGKSSPIWLFANGKISLPKWFRTHDWGVTVHLVQSALFADWTQALQPATVDGFQVTVSTRERAVMEAIHLIGKQHRFEEVTELFEGLTSLDADVVQSLLVACQSIKVRRIFLFLARQSGHTWFSKLDELKIDLGKGKREVVKGGKLDSRYLITVPRTEKQPDV